MKRSMPQRKSPPRKRSAKRGREIVRTMGTPKRRKFVASLPCAACCVEGYSVNAHLLGVEGMSLKKPATTIGPLCDDRFQAVGCHTLHDEHRSAFDAAFPDFDAEAVVARTQSLWEAHSGGSTKVEHRAHEEEGACL